MQPPPATAESATNKATGKPARGPCRARAGSETSNLKSAIPSALTVSRSLPSETAPPKRPRSDTAVASEASVGLNPRRAPPEHEFNFPSRTSAAVDSHGDVAG